MSPNALVGGDDNRVAVGAGYFIHLSVGQRLDDGGLHTQVIVAHSELSVPVVG